MPLDIQEFHKTGIGASEIAAVCGESPFKSPIKVYRQKLGIIEPDPDNPNMQRGRELEPYVVDKFVQATGNRVIYYSSNGSSYKIDSDLVQVVPQEGLRHPEHEWMLCLLDGMICGENFDVHLAPLEAKTASARTRHLWGTEESDEVPRMYLLQVQQQMKVCRDLFNLDIQEAHIPLLIDLGLRTYVVPYNEELVNSMIAIGDNFWKNHVLAEVPPDVDDSQDYADFLKHLYPHGKPIEIPASNEAAADVMELIDVRTRLKELDSRKKLLVNRITDFMGDAHKLVGDNWWFNWKEAAGSVSWKKIAEELRRRLDISDEDFSHICGGFTGDSYRKPSGPYGPALKEVD